MSLSASSPFRLTWCECTASHDDSAVPLTGGPPDGRRPALGHYQPCKLHTFVPLILRPLPRSTHAQKFKELQRGYSVLSQGVILVSDDTSAMTEAVRLRCNNVIWKKGEECQVP